MKKKILVSLLLALTLALSLGAAARAEARIDYVTDGAALLTDAQRQTLNERAAQLSQQYSCGIYIVTVGDYTDYVDRGGIERFAEEVFDSYGLGLGDTGDGVLLALSMKERDYDIYAHGNFGNAAFTDYGKSRLAERFLDNFRANDWAGGLEDFVSYSGELIRRARDGNPEDIWIADEPADEDVTGVNLIMGFTIGAVLAGVTVGSFKRQMKTAVKQTRAANYVAQAGVKLRAQQDEFLRRTVTSTVIRQESGSRSGGHYGGTSISGSHGGSHHSGKF